MIGTSITVLIPLKVFCIVPIIHDKDNNKSYIYTMEAKKNTPVEDLKHYKPLVSKESVEKNKRNIKFIAIHCAATKPSMEVPISRITKWHVKRGFRTVGYHYYIRRDGSLELGRPIDETGAHVKDFNSVSIGICYEGGINENGEPSDNRTEMQLKTMIKLLIELGAEYPKAVIKGHRDFPKVYKACPSFDVREWCEFFEIEHNQI